MFSSTSIDKHWAPLNEQENLFVKSGTRCIRNNSNIVTACKRSLGQGNIFTSLCQSFCLQGVPSLGGGVVGGGSILGGVLSLSRRGAVFRGGAILGGAVFRGGGAVNGWCHEGDVL